MTSRITLVAAVLFAAACGGPNPAPPVHAMGLALNKQGQYEVRELELRTLTNATALEGKVAKLTGGASIVIDSSDPALQRATSEDQLENIFVKNKGMDVRANYVEKDAVLWPADFHTWNMVTTYYNFERAFEYFQGIYDGKNTDALLNARVFYFPIFTQADLSPTPINDNALFFSPVQAFAILPFDKLQQVPLSINIGVIGHEYSHRVFNQRVYAGRALPTAILTWASELGGSPGLNVLKSIDEGLADYHAFGLTCLTDPGCTSRFLSTSLPSEFVDERDFALPNKCMLKSYREAIDTLSASQFSGQGVEYKVGTVLASALYWAGEKAGKRQVLQKALINAYSDSDPAKPGFAELINDNLQTPFNFTLAAVANSIAAHITDPDLQRLTCNEFLDRLQVNCPSMPCTELPACPASSAKGTTCPDINQ
jgi:hypothetical protein